MSLVNIFKQSRLAMTEMECDGMSAMFRRGFGLTEGDYLTTIKEEGQVPKVVRILNVRRCFPNARGGYTADLQVASFLSNGKVGISKGICISTTKKKGVFRYLHITGTGVARPYVKPTAEDVIEYYK